MKYLQNREFHGYVQGKDRKKVVIQEISLLFWVCNSGFIFLQCFNTCGISFLTFDKSIEFFGDREFFSRGLVYFRCNQVFHIVPIGLPT